MGEELESWRAGSCRRSPRSLGRLSSYSWHNADILASLPMWWMGMVMGGCGRRERGGELQLLRFGRWTSRLEYHREDCSSSTVVPTRNDVHRDGTGRLRME